MPDTLGNASSRLTTLFRYSDGALPNVLAIAYAFGGYGAGLALLIKGGWAWPVGVLLLAHSLVIAAYLLHECVHGALFAVGPGAAKNPHRILGGALSWLTGACYARLDKLSDKHLRHHFDRADLVTLDYRQLLRRRPGLRKLVQAGQFLCLPAIDLMMHFLALALPFRRGGSGQERVRILWVAALRGGYFFALFQLGGWPVLVGYALAYLMLLTVLNFMDAFQHQYLMLAGLDTRRSQSPTRDTARFAPGYFSREYEDGHTFSNLLSSRYPWVNLLVLNFAYHNVHHHQPMEPWYRLPSLHRRAVKECPERVNTVPLRVQLRDFFRYRVARVMAPATDQLEGVPNLGAAGVSFLTPL